MTGYVHVNGERAEKTKKAIFSGRKTKTKMMLFTNDIIIFIMMVLVAGSMMLVDSYLKAYRNRQNVEIIRKLDMKKELSFRQNEIKATYSELISSKELMKKANELGLTVATSDRVIRLK